MSGRTDIAVAVADWKLQGMEHRDPEHTDFTVGATTSPRNIIPDLRA